MRQRHASDRTSATGTGHARREGTEQRTDRLGPCGRGQPLGDDRAPAGLGRPIQTRQRGHRRPPVPAHASERGRRPLTDHKAQYKFSSVTVITVVWSCTIGGLGRAILCAPEPIPLLSGSGALGGATVDRMESLYPPADAARYLAVTVTQLRDWRFYRTGPAYLKLGHRTVRYRREDLDAWLRRNRVAPGSGDAA